MNKAIWLLGALIATSGILFFYQDHRIKQLSEEKALIIIGTSAEYQPFTFRQNDTITGFEIEVTQEVVNRLNKKVQLYDMPFDALIPEAQLGNIQVIAAGITPTPERAEHILFTEPYITHDPLVVVTRKPFSIQSITDLAGKKVAVNEGYTADFYMTKQENIELHRLTIPTEAFIALENGVIDAFVTARNCAKQYINRFGVYKFNIHTIAATNDTYSLGISKKYADLLPEISVALNELKKDGTLETLIKKWHIVGTINGASNSLSS